LQNQSSGPSSQSGETTGRDALPQTAGLGALVLLLGLGSLGGGLWLSRASDPTA
jgi:hypothetical protein